MEVFGDNIQADCKSESMKPYDLSMRGVRATKSEWSPEVIEVPDDVSTPDQSPAIDIDNDSKSPLGLLICEDNIKTEDPPTLEPQEASTSTDKRHSAFHAYDRSSYLQPHLMSPLYSAQQMQMPSPFPSIYNYDSRAMTYPFPPWGMMPQPSFPGNANCNGNFMESAASHGPKLGGAESLGLEQTPFSKYFAMNEIDRYNQRFGLDPNLQSSLLQRNLNFVPPEDYDRNRNISYNRGRNFEEKLNSHSQLFNSFAESGGAHPLQIERAAHPMPDLESLRNSPPYEFPPAHNRHSLNERSSGNKNETFNRSSNRPEPHYYGPAFHDSKFHRRRSYSTDQHRVRDLDNALEITPEERKPLIEFVKQEMIRRLTERRNAKRKELIDLRRRKLRWQHSRSPSPDNEDLNFPGTSRIPPTHSASSNNQHNQTIPHHMQTFMTFTQKNLYLDHPYYKCTKEFKSSMPEGRSNQGDKTISSRSNSPRLKTSTQKRQQKRCSYCLNHNLTILVRGHKGKCAHKECKCRACEITRSRQLHVMREHRIVKERAKNELLILENP